jgi:iron complex transport system ATP-binding protein
LFNTLLGLLPVQAGQVFLDGTSLVELAQKQIAQRVAYLPQAYTAHFPFRVIDMLVMGGTAHLGRFAGPTSHDRQRAQGAKALLGIADLAEREYTRTSGGQRQLALVARALAQDAPAIVDRDLPLSIAVIVPFRILRALNFRMIVMYSLAVA